MYKPDQLMIELLTSLKNEGFDIVVVNDGSGEEFEPVFEEARRYALVLDQTIRQVNIQFIIERDQFERAQKALHHEFVERQV